MSAFGILFDQSKCIGCKACELACQVEHGQRPHSGERLDHETFNWVKPAGPERFVRRFCMHCVEPACASACLVKALEKTPEGPVVYHPDRCMGCRYCMVACPFGVPKFEFERAIPIIRKCSFCVDRLRRGEAPACARACPSGALEFGERKVLLEASSQVHDLSNGRVDFPHLLQSFRKRSLEAVAPTPRQSQQACSPCVRLIPGFETGSEMSAAVDTPVELFSPWIGERRKVNACYFLNSSQERLRLGRAEGFREVICPGSFQAFSEVRKQADALLEDEEIVWSARPLVGPG